MVLKLDRSRHKWTKEEKLNAISRVLFDHEMPVKVALDLMLASWINHYQKNSYN